MTDVHKQLSIADLDLPPKRGRPKSGNALSNAQKQKLYRERAKQAGKGHVLLEPFEASLLETLISHHILGLHPDDAMVETYAEIRRKIQRLM